MSTETNIYSNPSTLVLGLGIGTFILLFFFIILFFVWLFTIPCININKLIFRSIATIAYIILALALIFADRQPEFPSSEPVTKIYDNSMVPRIAITVIMIAFSIISIKLIIDHFTRKEELSTIIHDYHDLWVN